MAEAIWQLYLLAHLHYSTQKETKKQFTLNFAGKDFYREQNSTGFFCQLFYIFIYMLNQFSTLPTDFTVYLHMKISKIRNHILYQTNEMTRDKNINHDHGKKNIIHEAKGRKKADEQSRRKCPNC